MFGTSQGLSMGFGTGSSYFSASPSGAVTSQLQDSRSPESGGKRSKQDDKQTCLPVTVRSVLDAVEARSVSGDDDVSIHGLVPGTVILVGVVESLVKQAASLECTLNDASGRIGVRYYMTEESNTGIEKITPGRYVSIVGSLRTSPAVHISVLRMRVIDSADEISYHMIEAAHAFLRLTRTVTPASQRSQPVSEPLTPPKTTPKAAESLGMGGTVTQTIAPPSAADLRTQLVKLLQSEGGGREEGVKLDLLVQRFGKVSADNVRKILEQLVEDGEAFNTIDDEHFACI